MIFNILFGSGSKEKTCKIRQCDDLVGFNTLDFVVGSGWIQKNRFCCSVARFGRQSGTPSLMQGLDCAAGWCGDVMVH